MRFKIYGKTDVPFEDLDPDDQDEHESITEGMEIESCDRESALDEFHMTQPIAALDDWEIVTEYLEDPSSSGLPDPIPPDTKVTITEGRYTGFSGVVKRPNEGGGYRVNVANVGVRNFKREHMIPRVDQERARRAQEAVFKVDGYFIPRPGESHEAAFARARDECMMHMNAAMADVGSLTFSTFKKSLGSRWGQAAAKQD